LWGREVLVLRVPEAENKKGVTITRNAFFATAKFW
jgi:hypothetical protein